MSDKTVERVVSESVEDSEVMESSGSRLTKLQQSSNPWCMRKIETFDVEAKDWVEAVAVGCFDVDDDEYREFTAEGGNDLIREFVEYALQPSKRGTRYVAHNLDYDLGHIVNELERVVDERNEKVNLVGENNKVEFGMEFLQSGNDIIYCEVCRKEFEFDPEGDEWKVERSYSWRFQDSVALIRGSLEQVVSAFASDWDGKEDFDVSKMDEPKAMKEAGDWSDMLEYLRVDCVALADAIRGFQKTLVDVIPAEDAADLNCGLTAASTAMRVFRRFYLQDSISGCSAEAERAFREAYYGGRTEVFRNEFDKEKHNSGEAGYHFDVNSLYPHVYGFQAHPTGEVKERAATIDSDFERQINKWVDNGFGGVAKVEVEVPADNNIPTLPCKAVMQDEDYEKMIFPVGKVQGWYNIRELKRAIEWDDAEILSMNKAFIAELNNEFEEFTKDFYAKKKSIDGEEQPGKYAAVKLLINSFWGKFGMGRCQEGIVKKSKIKESEYDKIKPLGGSSEERIENSARGIFKTQEVAESNYILPRVAQSVTAQARVEMTEWIEKVQQKGGRVWYMDTDSLMCDVELEESDEIGGMDLENRPEQGVFVAPKTYAEVNKNSGEIVKAKGIARDARESLGIDVMRRASAGEKITVEWDAPAGARTTFRRGDFELKTHERLLPNGDSKRVSCAGVETKPHELDQEWARRRLEEKRKKQQVKRAKEITKHSFDELTAQQEIDTQAQRDSTLSASEQKEREVQRRKDKANPNIY